MADLLPLFDHPIADGTNQRVLFQDSRRLLGRYVIYHRPSYGNGALFVLTELAKTGVPTK